jgi:hypothetical protein
MFHRGIKTAVQSVLLAGGPLQRDASRADLLLKSKL